MNCKLSSASKTDIEGRPWKKDHELRPIQPQQAETCHPMVVKAPSQPKLFEDLETKERRKLNLYLKKRNSVIKGDEIRVAENVYKSFQRLHQTLKIYGYRGAEGTDKSVDYFLNMVKESGCSWLKIAKYKIAAFAAFHLKQPLPESPLPKDYPDNPAYILTGASSRFLRILLNKKDLKAEVIQSIKHWKSAWERPSVDLLRKAEVEFVKEMTAPQGPDPDPISFLDWFDIEKPNTEFLLARCTIETQLKRTVKELFDHYPKYKVQDRVREFFPSTSANYNNNRLNGGAVGYVLQHPELLQGLRRPKGYLKIYRESQEEMSSKEEITEGEQKTYIKVENTEFLQKFSQLYFRILKRALQTKPLAKPMALAESLKIRIITMEEPVIQTALKPLQKFLHTRLRDHRVFQLLGRPQSEQVVLDALGRNLGDDEYYLSGDYASATNDLKSWVSECIAEQIAESIGLTQEERLLFLNSLTRHIFNDDKGVELTQTKGQLMGSITSFPVLCIANAALSRWAWEISHNKKILLRDIPMLINGDDVALRGNQNLYRVWSKVTSFAGLNESLGKTYFSRDFVDINSTNFQREKDEFQIDCVYDGKVIKRMTKLKQTPYVNLGLMYGFVRSEGLNKGSNSRGGLNDLSNIGDFEARARELLKYSRAELHESIMTQFLRAYWKPLTESRLPWYIPQWLGGIGLTTGSWGTYSDKDQRIAQRILYNWKTTRPCILKDTDMPWKTWNRAQEGLPPPRYMNTPGRETEHYSQLVARKCIDLLFDSEIQLEDLFGSSKGQRFFHKVNHNRKLWETKTKNYPRALPPESIIYQTRYPNYVKSEVPKYRLQWTEEESRKRKFLSEVKDSFDLD
jgi:hypothetical protein